MRGRLGSPSIHGAAFDLPPAQKRASFLRHLHFLVGSRSINICPASSTWIAVTNNFDLTLPSSVRSFASSHASLDRAVESRVAASFASAVLALANAASS